MSWHRTSRQSRGYDEAYLRARKLAMERDDYLCQCDRCQGGLLRLRPAHECDHIIPLADFRTGKATGDPHDLSNLRAVHRDCHRRIGLEQRGSEPAIRYDRNGRRIADE